MHAPSRNTPTTGQSKVIEQKRGTADTEHGHTGSNGTDQWPAGNSDEVRHSVKYLYRSIQPLTGGQSTH